MVLNGTVPNALNELYPGLTDFSSLSWFEQQWVAWYVWIGNPVIATGLMSFLMHEVCCRIVYSERQKQLRRVAFLLLILISAPRLFTSDAASRGSSSTRFLISASGSYNPTRFRLLLSNGHVRSKCFSPISRLSCRWYVTSLSGFLLGQVAYVCSLNL